MQVTKKPSFVKGFKYRIYPTEEQKVLLAMPLMVMLGISLGTTLSWMYAISFSEDLKRDSAVISRHRTAALTFSLCSAVLGLAFSNVSLPQKTWLREKTLVSTSIEVGAGEVIGVTSLGCVLIGPTILYTLDDERLSVWPGGKNSRRSVRLGQPFRYNEKAYVVARAYQDSALLIRLTVPDNWLTTSRSRDGSDLAGFDGFLKFDFKEKCGSFLEQK